LCSLLLCIPTHSTKFLSSQRWFEKDSNGQSVNLSSSSDLSYLRIRIRSRNEDDNENDGAKSNQGDVKLKIRHIARIGSDREKNAECDDDGEPHKFSSHFMIKMKQPIGEWTKFKFAAESLAERDTVVLAIRSLIEQHKYQADARSNRQSGSYHNRLVPEARQDTSILEGREGVEASIIAENSKRSSRAFDTQRSLIDDRRSSDDMYNVKAQSVSSKYERRSSRSRDGLDLEKKVVVESRDRFNMNDMNESLESVECNAMSCQTQALTAVEDGELANFAANQLAGPWCTDDVCTASLTGLADSMKGIFDLHDNSCQGLQEGGEKQRATAEQYITGFLGDNTNMTELLSVKDLWNVAATKHVAGKEIQIRKVQNRAASVDGKAVRLNGLKTLMTFSGANIAKHMTFLQTISSFDDVNRSGKRRRKKSSKTLEVAGQFDASPFLDRNVDLAPERDECDILYYDSDPGDARERTMKRGPRMAIAERQNVVDDSAIPPRREALDILGSSRLGHSRRWRRLGEEVVHDIIEVSNGGELDQEFSPLHMYCSKYHDFASFKIQATKNEKLTLMWHPSQTDKKNDTPTTVCVKLWVEAGVYLVDGTFLLPKLTWLPAHESNLHARVLNTSADSPGSLDLLDVCRVKECETIDRNIHPFAIASKSFEVITQNGRYLFETQSKQERGRVVNGLKLVIARLASLLMLRDLRAVDEFFGGNNSVPGEAPQWARTEKNESSSEFPGAS
jgi:hypothetical protein